MKYETINDLQEIVSGLNNHFEDTIFLEMKMELNYLPFNLSAGQTYGNPTVEFMGVYLWGGQDETRKYDEAKDEYENLHDYLIKQASIVLKQLNTGMGALVIETSDTDE